MNLPINDERLLNSPKSDKLEVPSNLGLISEHDPMSETSSVFIRQEYDNLLEQPNDGDNHVIYEDKQAISDNVTRVVDNAKSLLKYVADGSQPKSYASELANMIMDKPYKSSSRVPKKVIDEIFANKTPGVKRIKKYLDKQNIMYLRQLIPVAGQNILSVTQSNILDNSLKSLTDLIIQNGELHLKFHHGSFTQSSIPQFGYVGATCFHESFEKVTEEILNEKDYNYDELLPKIGRSGVEKCHEGHVITKISNDPIVFRCECFSYKLPSTRNGENRSSIPHHLSLARLYIDYEEYIQNQLVEILVNSQTIYGGAGNTVVESEKLSDDIEYTISHATFSLTQWLYVCQKGWISRIHPILKPFPEVLLSLSHSENMKINQNANRFEVEIVQNLLKRDQMKKGNGKDLTEILMLKGNRGIQISSKIATDGVVLYRNGYKIICKGKLGNNSSKTLKRIINKFLSNQLVDEDMKPQYSIELSDKILFDLSSRYFGPQSLYDPGIQNLKPTLKLLKASPLQTVKNATIFTLPIGDENKLFAVKIYLFYGVGEETVLNEYLTKNSYNIYEYVYKLLLVYIGEMYSEILSRSGQFAVTAKIIKEFISAVKDGLKGKQSVVGEIQSDDSY